MRSKKINNKAFILQFLTILSALSFILASAANAADAKNEVKGSFISDNFEVKYEVSVRSGGGSVLLDFFSAYNGASRNMVHVALINSRHEKPLSPEIFFDEKVRKLSETCKNAVLAINGGYYAIMNDIIYSSGGVYGNFKKYPFFIDHPKYPYFCVFDDNSADIINSAGFQKLSSLRTKKVKYYIQSKPMLVYDGKTPSSLMASPDARTSKNPRTAIAKLKNGDLMCVIVEGRREDAAGMTQVELSKLLIKAGAVRALNLDGGGSSTVILNGVLMNRTAGGLSPITAPGEERPIHSSILFQPK